MLSTRDQAPVEGGDITELLRACLVALRLPPKAEADQPRRSPFWSMGDAAHRMTRLLETRPEGTALDTFLPKISGAGAHRALHARAAVAATLMAALELSRNGALTLQQEQGLRMRFRVGLDGVRRLSSQELEHVGIVPSGSFPPGAHAGL
jgi:chromatin segregation and condensation protein Rec8/ScpA/Scc1 (kleisin family)